MKTFRVMVPTDFSEGADLALEHALYLTKKFEGELHILHVAELPTMSIPDFPADLFDFAYDQAMAKMTVLLDKHGDHVPPVTKAVQAGKPARPAAEVILTYADDNNIDFIVMGTHGRRGPRRFLLGSITEEVIRRASCPVFTVRTGKKAWPMPQIDRILVPVDFSHKTRQIIGVAARFAEHYDASITLMHVVNLEFYPFYGYPVDPIREIEQNILVSSETKLNEYVSELQGAGIITNWTTDSGHPAQQIRSFADENDFDLIVVGSHGRSGFDRAMVGSISEKVLRSAHCPVVVVNTGSDAMQLGVAA